jgi:hypothetical protein
MKRMILCFFAIAVIVMLSTIACSSGPDDPVNKVYGYLDNAVTILEQNKSNPDKAGVEIQTYYKSVEKDMGSALKTIKNNPIQLIALGTRLLPLLEKQQTLLAENSALGKSNMLTQSMSGFDFTSMIGGK